MFFPERRPTAPGSIIPVPIPASAPAPAPEQISQCPQIPPRGSQTHTPPSPEAPPAKRGRPSMATIFATVPKNPLQRTLDSFRISSTEQDTEMEAAIDLTL